MISPELQRLDEALTAAGHDENCAAFQGGPCSGPPICSGEPVPGMGMVTALRPHSAALAGPLAPVPGEVRLIGPAASAYLRYRSAAQRLKLVTAEFKRAEREYQEAHQAFADAAVDGG